jgi:hypothetical protein
MNQQIAQDIANKHHMDCGPVTFFPHGRGYVVRGYNCYDRVVEIFVREKQWHS